MFTVFFFFQNLAEMFNDDRLSMSNTTVNLLDLILRAN